jgi:hypothetical protein
VKDTLGSAIHEAIRHAVEEALDRRMDAFRLIVREELAKASSAGDPDELWDANRAAKALGTTPAALRRARERGTLGIEAVKVGRRSLRWRAGDVRALATSAMRKRGGQ